MKSKLVKLIALCIVFGSNTVNAALCVWSNGPYPDDSDLKTWTVMAPSSLSLRYVPVGSVMASSPDIIVTSQHKEMRCSYPQVLNMHVAVYIDQLQLADGFTDVYKTGLKGVGIRFVSVSRRSYKIPTVYDIKNVYPAGMNTDSVMKTMRIEFIRTAQDVMSGDINMNYKILHNLNGWNAGEINIIGSTKLQSKSYFSGCSGVEKLNISMGRVAIADLGKTQKSFNLDVLCSGLPAGTNLPVKVYFEGDSDGAGRLNLLPGGAQGVEISLLNDRGVKLPFSLAGALGMTWIRSESHGEIYRLPMVAEYVKKASQKFEAGKGNATLNYILEYN